MQDQSKIREVRGLLETMMENNQSYSDSGIATYYDYDKVLKLLQNASDTMTGTARNSRPRDLPKGIPGRETFADPNEEIDPYSYDGSMSLEDHERKVADFMEDKRLGLVDDHGQPTDGDTKIRYMDVHGRLTSETLPFPERYLDVNMKAATTRVNVDPRLAGWAALSYDKVFRVWASLTKDGVNPVYYDTGRRGGHTDTDAIHTPPELQTPIAP